MMLKIPKLKSFLKITNSTPGVEGGRFFLIITGLSLFILFVFIPPPNSFSATINVPGDYDTITDAISNGSAGDTIIIAAGTYTSTTETFPFEPKDNMTVQGAGSSTLIQGDGSNDVFNFATSGVTIKDLKIDSNGYGDVALIAKNGSSGTTLSNLIIYDSQGARDDSSGINVYAGSDDSRVENCIVYNLDGGIAAAAEGSNGTVDIYNCVVYNCTGSTYGTGFFAVSAGSDLIMNVYNSIAVDCTTGIGHTLDFGGTATISSSYNCFNNTTNYGTAASAGTGDIQQTPFFIDAPNADFHLQSKNRGYENDSPCIDTGTSTSVPSTDISGTTRPQGNAVDMGAYEHAAATGYLTSFSKKANKRKASTGQVITYTIGIRNTTYEDILNAQVTDVMPKGFRYLDGTATLDGNSLSDPEGARTRTFTLGTLSANTNYTLKYKSVIGSGVGYGKKTNTAYLVSSIGNSMSSQAQETVTVAPNPIFNAATIIGKVFLDKNKNGYQDEGEEGLPHIDLITEDGYMATTDKYGRYHIEGLKPQTKIVALMTKTLPKRAVLTTENPVLLRFTVALTMKANFGVYIEEESIK